MKSILTIVAALAAGAVLASLTDPIRQALAQDRSQIMLTPKSRFEHVVAGEHIWMLDSANNQMIGCRFGGANGGQLACEKTKLP